MTRTSTMKTLTLIAFGLCLTTAAASAQTPKGRVKVDGVTCEVDHPKKHETRVKCDNGAWDGVRHNDDGTVDELVKVRDWKTLGLTHAWKTKRVTRIFEPEKDPLLPSPVSAEEIARDYPQASADNPVVIDVAYVWSQAAQNAVGGLANMQARAVLLSAIATQTYANSGVPWASTRLVGTKLVSYHENMTNSSGTQLSPLTWLYYSVNGIAPWGDECKVLRKNTGADLTQILTTDDPCGVGYLSCNGSTCLSHSEIGCSASNLTSVHEMGHNEGAHHNNLEGGAPNCGVSGNTQYNCGFNWGPARDVMAYSGGGRVRHLSSATVKWTDAAGVQYATGNVYHDNARVLAEQAARIAAQNTPPTALLPGAGGSPQPKVN